MRPPLVADHPPLEQAMHYHSEGRLAEAEALFRRVIAADPASHTALHALGILLLERGQYTKAVDCLEEAIVLQENTALYYRSLGDALAAGGDTERATSAYQTSLFLDPLQTEAKEGLAALAEQAGNHVQAIDYLADALAFSPNKGTILARLARLYAESGRVDEACHFYARAMDVRPWDLQLAIQYADLLLSSGQNVACEDILCRIGGFYPANPEINRRLGVLYFRNDLFDEALMAFELAMAQAPFDRQLLIDYVICLRTVGDDGSAEQVLRRLEGLRHP